MSNHKLILISFLFLILSIFLYYSFDTSYEEIEIRDSNSNAKCIDGSNYKFLFSKGFGNGSNSFYIYFESGGFCGDKNYDAKDNDAPLKDCYDKRNSQLGSNKFKFIFKYFNKFASRFFTSSKYYNPIFYNWNKVFIKYCDGTFHIGNIKEPIQFNNTQLFIRGEENVKSVFNYLIKNNNFSNAKDVVGVGSSAGGIAVVFYSKYIRSLISDKTNYKIISDSGYFHHGNYKGLNIMDDMMIKLMNNLNIKQTETMKMIDENLDFFHSSNTIQYINKLNNDYPILFLTSSYDSWALENLINSTCFLGFKIYDSCALDEIKDFEEYSKDVEEDFLQIIKNDKSKMITAFIPKGFFHTFLIIGWSWNVKSYGVDNYSVQQFINDWYYGLLPKYKRMFYDSDNVLKYKIDAFWMDHYLNLS